MDVAPAAQAHPVSRTIDPPLIFSTMTKVEKLEREVQGLTGEELAAFRDWFAAFDAAMWDRQIEADAKAGRLDALADEALADHRAGRTRKL